MSKDDLLNEMLYTKQDMIDFGVQVAEQGITEDDVNFFFTALYEFEKEADNG